MKGQGFVSIKHLLPVSTPSRIVSYPIWLILPCFGVLCHLSTWVLESCAHGETPGRVGWWRVERSFLLIQKNLIEIDNTVSIPRRVERSFLLRNKEEVKQFSQMYQYPEGSSARFYIETNLDNPSNVFLYQYPEGSSARFYSALVIPVMRTDTMIRINTPKGRALVSTQNLSTLVLRAILIRINTPKGRALVSTRGRVRQVWPNGKYSINTPKGRALVSTARYCLFYTILQKWQPYIAVFSFASISKK